MINLHLIKENLEAIKENVKNRNMSVDLDLVLHLFEKKNSLKAQIDKQRNLRNENAKQLKGKVDQNRREFLVAEGKALKIEVAKLEQEMDHISDLLQVEALKIPNMAHPDAPLGADDRSNKELKQIGNIPQFSFKPLDHVELGETLDLVDFEAGSKVSGSKFYFLKNQAVLLEFALVRYALDILMRHGFTIYQTPDIARESILQGIGFNPRGAESNIYPLEGEETCLVGTAEITLGGYHAGDIVDVSKKPILMAGVSHCFRREAGSAGQFSKGLYRVHQFTKVEMFCYCKPQESDQLHEFLRDIEEEIFIGLNIPFRVVDTAIGDLGAPAYRKYDLEAWMPGRGEHGDWGEITSTSNCTDFQSRRLNVRYKDSDGKNQFVHTLNGTAIAISRAMVAIFENYQQADGSIRMPTILVPYLGFDHIPNPNI
ncbi:serine--tRNA ligase [Entomospira culicis]|uniref:Serine--tRNA ligase n=1 Tax=Entomospira culicis TaxID=2719989 RepID=A0A968KUS7_9SPIO|nr:serine--tRNA ligase [Entomospira culicis]NIZ19660.1 serine--tRNA ligase [Entomospira culicis]NIZ69874.1 serine--tRNA ligase [Entomospira culicis]WDI36979.1 serine--tRNA ligase [Entomospira culicis]WDI38608.1 serine--tRNA ligase [Entomospira culicis]